ncbi:MAG: HAMP domain-containing sensor histidine kinase [Planctomycetota bacterium]
MATAEANPRTFHAPAARRDDDAVRAEALAFVADGPLAAVLDAIPSLILVLDAQRQVIFANAAAQRVAAAYGTTPVLGRRPGEVLACRNVADAPSGCGTGRACRTCGAVNALLEALHGRPATEECRIGTRRGDALDLRATATPFRWGGREYALMVLDDVSDAKRRAVLERTFFHDILNTAGGVSGIAGLIVADPDACREFRHDLLSSATQLVNEIKCQQMLLSAEQGELVVERVLTGTRRLLEDARQLYAHHPVAEGRRLEVAPGTDDVALTTDPAVVGRVLGNLVKNALEASAPGEVVVIGARATDDGCELWCHNGGVIPPEHQPQVFQRSFSTKGEGRGIGTYSVRLLTEHYLHGRVGFTSSPEAGTRFTVALPRSLPAQAPR